MRSLKLQLTLTSILGVLFLFATPTEALAVPIQSLNGATGQTQTFQSDSNVTISTDTGANIHSLGWNGYLPISRGGTGVGVFTAGSIPFIFGGVFAQDNSNFFWDNTNKRLGIGTSSPTTRLDVNGNTNISGNLTVSGNINASNLVPYTGATQNVNLGSHNFAANTLVSNGDSTINTLNVGLGGGSFAGNTVLGTNALVNNITGARNVAVGNNALFANTHNDNTAVGADALGSSLYDGDGNTAVGSQTLQANTAGENNNAYGYQALAFNTTGIRNVGIGSVALQSNTTGSINTALGVGALSNNTTGGGNVAIGYNAAANQTNDNYSIVIGDNTIGAGTYTTVIGNSGMREVYFGSAAGLANIHAKKMYLGSSTTPGCIIMGDSDGNGITYITVNDGTISASTTPPSACQ